MTCEHGRNRNECEACFTERVGKLIERKRFAGRSLPSLSDDRPRGRWQDRCLHGYHVVDCEDCAAVRL